MSGLSVIYLHGFVSGPDGEKALYLRDRFAEAGIDLRRPDLNTPDFEHMTLTAIVARVAAEVEACPSGPVVLIGSSLGGFAALQFLKQRGAGLAKRVEKLVLLAPALEFPTRFWSHAHQEFGPDALAAWRAVGSVPMHHYAYDREMPLGVAFGEDLLHWSDGFDVQVDAPVLILHGMRDESVPYTLSTRFAGERENVALHLFSRGDHGMLDFLPQVWTQIRIFIGV